ncbi:alpha/beta fold hydrolase [Desertibaculum subflavum]|uniref:alpha/beta fold hydrolase n=1 Tax=Desertibaculum subflavum TaxID=2268458 RepID=UPI000E6737D3
MNRQPLILVPGLLCSEDLWRDQIAGLADIAEPMATMEHAAHDSIPAIARAVLEKAPSRFALAGLSMGGYIAFEILRQAQDRVIRAALLDTSARPDTPEQVKFRQDMLALAKVGKFKGVTSRLLPQFVHPDRANDTELLSRLEAGARKIGSDGFLRQQTAIMARVDSRPGLADIRVPTLVLVGRQDARTPPPLAEEIAAGITGSRLVYIEESGHLPTMEQPEATNRALRDWLAA